MTYLGNSINIVGKNRFLTSNLMFSTTEYFREKIAIFLTLMLLLMN
jgi:hypothetical protein